ncbi:hypothetical protein BHU72_08640 [Desulfuribacillus stibiiarsenatis]|uniref:HD-GYP domain-containing protein n=1 Tax=Desulfuribacillus stibiiarsenatis TaxID=1390249 RepID=A0A1E5L346_9FIRM|nr:HD-GYP domain-containing protein [Desulfuribacillus stibiiarsenatis]OEH84565.1 hypothetical protein BHU72_08640 [Desulfuribacillus stibiiarsenatis]
MSQKIYDHSIKPIDFCDDGDVLGEDIFSDHGKLILAQGTELNKDLIRKLKSMGIFAIQIRFSTENKNSDTVYYNTAHKQIITDAYRAIETILSVLWNRKTISVKEHEQHLVNLVQTTMSSGDILDIIQQIQVYDDYTCKHSLAVGTYATLLATWLGYGESDVKTIGLAGLLHDIGKTKVDLEIINKKDSLNFSQWDKVHRHPVYSHDIIKFNGFHDQHLLKAIAQHHERNDGSGYPKGLRAKDIHPYAQIIAVADSYHAMTTDKSYGKKKSHVDALKDLWNDAFCKLDPEIVLVFINGMMGKYMGRICQLTNGEAGKVVFIHRDEPTSPIVRVGRGEQAKYLDLRYEKRIKIKEIL